MCVCVCHATEMAAVLTVLIAVNCRGSPWAVVGHRGAEDKHARDTDFLNAYADKQWEVRKKKNIHHPPPSCLSYRSDQSSNIAEIIRGIFL